MADDTILVINFVYVLLSMHVCIESLQRHAKHKRRTLWRDISRI